MRPIRLEAIIPGAKKHIMRGCAHWPQWERPEEHDQVVGAKFMQGALSPHVTAMPERYFRMKMNATPVRRRQDREQARDQHDKRMNDAKTQSQYQPYKDAAWGFINHWYPALCSPKSCPTSMSRASRSAACRSCCAEQHGKTLRDQGPVRTPRRPPLGEADLLQRHLDRLLVSRLQFRPRNRHALNNDRRQSGQQA
jgi:hypothetical protein